MAMLEVENIHSYYGNIHALKGISLTVDKGEIVTLIGGNGAGKTTTLRTITGIMKPREGKVSLEGENLDRYKAHQIVFKGIAMVPEGRRIFGRLTAWQNWIFNRPNAVGEHGALKLYGSGSKPRFNWERI